jgi:hypothetical protein
MNHIDYLAAAAALFNAFTWDKVIPLLTLVAMFGAITWMLKRAQAKPDFHLEQMFWDENDKTSASRVIALFAFAVSSWDLMAARMADKSTPEQFWGYLAAWSGALVFVKFADKWDGSLPFGKGKQG